MIGLSDSPECVCLSKNESSKHFFIDCFLYSPEFQILLSLLEHYIPEFNKKSKNNKLDIILRGINVDDEEYLQFNTILPQALQNCILSNKRFALYDPPD